ncbi:MAG TPA: hypothetical protein DCM05_15475 [Elusimicrobia bacterium]|nr:hypothetical protein [Elusimicrobiota bacterium]
MNAMSYLRDVETMGAREFRQRLDSILRSPTQPYRVMLHNKPALAVIPDDEFLQILELLEELRSGGLLKRAVKKLEAAHKKRGGWFWRGAWPRKEAQADKELRAGKARRAGSASELIRQLNA